MTEQQIQQLKTLLEQSDTSDNSPDLDERILNTASARADSRKNAAPSSIRSGLLGFLPHGFIRSAAFSIVLTLAVFLGLGQILSSDEENELLATAPILVEIKEQVSQPELLAKPTVSSPALPEYEFTYPPITEHARDQILAQMELPDTQTMLNNMEFQLDADRVFAEEYVAQAMSEIRFMINDGEMNNARQRYELLRRLCRVCTLPKTLEALALNDQGRPSSG